MSSKKSSFAGMNRSTLYDIASAMGYKDFLLQPGVYTNLRHYVANKLNVHPESILYNETTEVRDFVKLFFAQRPPF